MRENELIIKPHLCGVNTSHCAGFEIDREYDPYGTCLILCFRSRCWILCDDGLKLAYPGDCIVHTVDFRQHHYSLKDESEGYRNDWLHCEPEAIERIMAELKLPYNHLIHTGVLEITSPHIKMMQEEMLDIDDYSNMILKNLLKGMLLAIAKNSRKSRKHKFLTQTEQAYYDMFCSLRKKMLEDCCVKIEVKDMAAKVNLSPERFAVLYRKFFNASPYSEIMDARILKAKRLLLGSSMGIQEIAEECNWENIYYFSRLFKQKTGLPPGKYRYYKTS